MSATLSTTTTATLTAWMLQHPHHLKSMRDNNWSEGQAKCHRYVFFSFHDLVCNQLLACHRWVVHFYHFTFFFKKRRVRRKDPKCHSVTTPSGSSMGAPLVTAERMVTVTCCIQKKQHFLVNFFCCHWLFFPYVAWPLLFYAFLDPETGNVGIMQERSMLLRWVWLWVEIR